MSEAPGQFWPWVALVGLGFFHGINPAMGWLFAVALGLHRQNRKIVLLSWVPITLGHAVAVAAVLFVALSLGPAVGHATLSHGAAAMLLGWAVWHAIRGHRQRVRIGMQTGLAGLSLWSFLMSSAHGAGLMLVPVLLPLCAAGSPPGKLTASGSIPIAAGMIGVHTAAMLATITTVSLIVYDWVGLAFLRSGWINFDLIWIAALGSCGVLLILV
jgi:hypothetical protein